MRGAHENLTLTLRSVLWPSNNHRRGAAGSGVDADHEHYKWWALSCTSLGMLLATINSGTLIIALPDLERRCTRASSRSSG